MPVSELVLTFRGSRAAAFVAALALVLAVQGSPAAAQAAVATEVAGVYDPSVFDNARSSYLSQCDGGAYLTDGSQPCLWAWLESNDHPSWVSSAIDIYLSDGCWADYCDPFYTFSTGYRVPALISIPIRYPDRISQADRSKILQAFADHYLDMWGANPNYQIHQQVGLYLYAKFFASSLTFVYDFWSDYPERDCRKGCVREG